MATITFKLVNSAKRGTSSYQSAEVPGTVYLSNGAFNGMHPAEITLLHVPEATTKDPETLKAERTAKAKAKRDALKAELAGMTPAQKAQRIAEKKAEQAKNAADKAAKLAAAEQPAL